MRGPKMELIQRKAKLTDLQDIVSLLANDSLGKTREQCSGKLDDCYIEAFKKIDNDDNQYLMAVLLEGSMIATCHLTLIPSLTFKGSTRLLIEAVRVDSKSRGKRVGEWMIKQAINYAKNSGASIIQLTTNKQRPGALSFYEKIGFQATHEGMKLYLEPKD